LVGWLGFNGAHTKSDIAPQRKQLYSYLNQKINIQNHKATYTGWAKNGLFLRVNNFVTANGRKPYDMSKIHNFV